MAQEWREVFHNFLTWRHVALFTPPASRPLFQIWAVGRQIIECSLFGPRGAARCGASLRSCFHAVDHPAEPLRALFRLRLREGSSLPTQPDDRNRNSCPSGASLCCYFTACVALIAEPVAFGSKRSRGRLASTS